MTKPEIVRAWCEQRVGCPYIYGATGKPCTPSYREARMAQYPAYAEKIKRNCPRLSGTATTCADCKWCDPETGIGKQAYDCAQLSRWAMDAVGIKLVSGANSQWERTDWLERGPIGFLPKQNVCEDEDHMGHVGVYQGDGWVIHAKAHDKGVVRERIEDVNFTHYGVPKGLYDGKPARPILRRGDSGPNVLYLQTLLSSVVGPIDTDGKFGPKTAAAVIAFQKANGLTVDGVVGPKTWDALEKATNEGWGDDIPSDSSPTDDPVIVSREDWDTLCRIVDKYRNVG